MGVMGGGPKSNLHLALPRVKVINMSFQLQTDAAVGKADSFMTSGFHKLNLSIQKHSLLKEKLFSLKL